MGFENNGAIKRSPNGKKSQTSKLRHDRSRPAASVDVGHEQRGTDAQLSSLNRELNIGGASHSERITVNVMSSLESQTRSVQTLDSEENQARTELPTAKASQ